VYIQTLKIILKVLKKYITYNKYFLVSENIIVMYGIYSDM